MMPGKTVRRGRAVTLPAIGPPTRDNPWAGSSTSLVTPDPIRCYRVWGGKSGRLGGWLTPVKPTSRAAAMAGLSLPPGNDASYVTEVWVPAGVRIQVGLAGPNFGQPGGWSQVELLQRIPRSCFGADEMLPPP